MNLNVKLNLKIVLVMKILIKIYLLHFIPDDEKKQTDEKDDLAQYLNYPLIMFLPIAFSFCAGWKQSGPKQK